MPRKAPDRSATLVVLLLVLHYTGPHDVDARFRGAVQKPIPTVEKNAGLAKAGAGVMQRSCCKKIAVRSSDDVSEVPVFFTKCFELFGMHNTPQSWPSTLRDISWRLCREIVRAGCYRCWCKAERREENERGLAPLVGEEAAAGSV